MAKRKTLTAPSADDLARLEDEFRRETTSRAPLSAPISHIAAEAAAAHDPRSPDDRAAAARDRTDAQRLRQAEEKGLVLVEIPLEEIDADALVRDRLALDPAEMTELQLSIASHGLRLPVEVFLLPPDAPSGLRYGLLSGYRRLQAVRNLRAMSLKPRYDKIRAIIRDPADLGGAVTAMVEENEVRANLSHFERGRIAVIAAQQGVFANVEAAVEALFPQASKAKRSKVRSFALIFEELGDMLTFPEALKEREGLRLATALRDGGERLVRAALDGSAPQDADEEWARIEAALADLTPAPRKPERGGRPPGALGKGRVANLSTGTRLSSEHDGHSWVIRIHGKRVDYPMVDTLMRELERLLGPA